MNAGMRILLSTIGTISKINPGDKLIVKNKSIVIDKRWIQWYRRKIDGESRHSTILFLEELYSEIKDRIDNIILNLENNKKINEMNYPLIKDEFESLCENIPEYESDKKEINNESYRILRSIANALGKSHKGIKNLIVTYDNDTSIISRLEFIIEIDIMETYIKIKKLLPKEFLPDKFLFDKNKIENCSVNVN